MGWERFGAVLTMFLCICRLLGRVSNDFGGSMMDLGSQKNVKQYKLKQLSVKNYSEVVYCVSMYVLWMFEGMDLYIAMFFIV